MTAEHKFSFEACWFDTSLNALGTIKEMELSAHETPSNNMYLPENIQKKNSVHDKQ